MSVNNIHRFVYLVMSHVLFPAHSEAALIDPTHYRLVTIADWGSGDTFKTLKV